MALPEAAEREVVVTAGAARLGGSLALPGGAPGVVAFAHGSGSGRHSPRNRFVAAALREAGVGTLLMDLLTEDEEAADAATGHLRFDIELLSQRVVAAIDWLGAHEDAGGLPVGCFGASTGAAAALVAAAQRPERVAAVVSRGGRPDLAGEALALVRAPTLLIVGGRDGPVIGMNEDAARRMRVSPELAIVPGAGHLFEEPGALERVAELARAWFARHLGTGPTREA
jgi:putative phosphoribosyl transferase